jgi:hypothetical protein
MMLLHILQTNEQNQIYPPFTLNIKSSFEVYTKKVDLLSQVDEYGLEMTSNAQRALYELHSTRSDDPEFSINGHKTQTAQACFLSLQTGRMLISVLTSKTPPPSTR